VLLELARHLGKNPPKIRVDLAAYTLHEADFPESGGKHHAKALKAKNVEVKAMIALEMVGYFSDKPKSQTYPVGILKLFYPSKGNYITVVGKPGSGSRKIIKKAMAKATPLPVRSFVGPVSLFGFFTRRSDHSLFWDEGYPGVMITDTSEFRNFVYHTPDDVPERLDYRRMAMVAVGMMNAIKVLGE
jgi:Zn-dependent M28 family amino/carboxypeptidase